jgi:hypothetical protein
MAAVFHSSSLGSDIFTRVGQNLLHRLHGPLTFRLILQPLTAAIVACRSGWLDARTGCPVYGWALLADPLHRRELIRHGWKEVARVFLFAVVVDLVWELVALHRFYPGESLIVAFFLALLPYAFLRSAVNLMFFGVRTGIGR